MTETVILVFRIRRNTIVPVIFFWRKRQHVKRIMTIIRLHTFLLGENKPPIRTVETLNLRMSQWNCLKNVWHHDLRKHSTVFYAVAVITQIEIENGEKLFDVSKYSD